MDDLLAGHHGEGDHLRRPRSGMVAVKRIDDVDHGGQVRTHVGHGPVHLSALDHAVVGHMQGHRHGRIGGRSRAYPLGMRGARHGQASQGSRETNRWTHGHLS